MPIVLDGTAGITTPNVSTDTSTLGPLTQALNLGSTGQIVFPATQNASANANTLDDYEEGTWTPTVTGWTSVTYTSQIGRYTKIGNQVTAWFYIQFSGTNNTASVLINGLPFTVAGTPNFTVGGALCFYNAPVNETTGVLAYPNPGFTTMQMFGDNDSGAAVSSNGNAAGQYFIGSVTYAAS